MIIDYTRLIQILNNSKVQTTNNPLYQVIFSLIRDSMQFQATIEGLLSELESSVNNINIKPIVLPNATIIPNDSDGEFNESFSIPGPPGKDGPIGPIGPAGASGNFITQFIPVYDAEDGQDSLIPGPLGPPGSTGSGTTIYSVCNGRLTTESGVPVSITDRSLQSTIYFTPYLGSQIGLFTSGSWAVTSFTEKSLALSGLTSDSNYDVFIYDNAGTLTLELSAVWTNNTTRSDTLTTQDGILVKSSNTSRRYIGTIRTTSTTTTEDSGGGITTQVGGKRFVWNYYNRVPRFIRVISLTNSWTYNGGWRIANGGTAPTNCVEYVTGDSSLLIDSEVIGVSLVTATSSYMYVAIGIDSSTPASGNLKRGHAGSSGNQWGGPHAIYSGLPGLGYHYIAWLERSGTISNTWYGDDGDTLDNGVQSGLEAIIDA